MLCHFGWGDGFHPVVTTHAADGSLLAVHIDLLVTGPDGPDGQREKEEIPTAPATV